MSLTGALTAESRKQPGTSSARALRREDKVPAVVYGNQKEPAHIAVGLKEVKKLMEQEGFYNRIITLTVDGKEEQVIAKELQRNPVTDKPEHIDFYRLPKDGKVSLKVPVHYTNEEKSPGLKLGGTLNAIYRSLEVKCRPDAIPAFLEIDLSGRQGGTPIRIDAVKFPEGVEASNPVRDRTLATISTGRGAKGAAAEAAAEDAQG